MKWEDLKIAFKLFFFFIFLLSAFCQMQFKHLWICVCLSFFSLFYFFFALLPVISIANQKQLPLTYCTCWPINFVSPSISPPAYKTLPNSVGEATDLVSSLMSEMNNSAYLDTLLASSTENQIEPTVAPASIGDLATLSPTQGILNGKISSDDPRLPLQLLPSLNSAIGPQIDLNNPLILGAALQNPTLAAMYFGLQQLSQQVTQYTTILKPTEVPSTETIYATKTVSFYDGRQTRTRTITEPASTTIKLVSTVTPQVQPVINPQVLVQQAQLQRAFASQLLQNNNNNNNNNINNNNNPFISGNPMVNGNNVLSSLLQQQQNNQGSLNQLNVNNLPIPSVPQISPSTVTETTVTLITTTSTSSKIYTLIYNAFSTKYRTVTSTTVYPTQITTTITKTITPSATAYNPFFGWVC